MGQCGAAAILMVVVVEMMMILGRIKICSDVYSWGLLVIDVAVVVCTKMQKERQGRKERIRYGQ